MKDFGIDFQDLKDKQKEENLTEYLNDTLIANIRTYRIQKGVSQRKLSKLSGVTQNIISRMENHLATPQFETLIKLAEALNLDVDISITPKV